jgi:hypothetical protein
MAERCDRNEEDEFGGCIVIIPPSSDQGEAEPIAVLLVDPARNQATFWSTVKGTANNAADEWQAQQQMPGRY